MFLYPRCLSAKINLASCPQIWNIEQERQRKRESRQQASKAQQEKWQERSRARDKNTKEIFFLLEEQHKNFLVAVRK